MKRIAILLLLIYCSVSAFSQGAGYRCTYEQKILFPKSDIPVEDEAIANVIKQVLKERKEYYILSFCNGKSLFERDNERSSDNFGMQSSIIYSDLNDNKLISQENFMGKQFLINESLRSLNWTITEETQQINGFNCIKAVVDDSLEANQVSAWFSSELPIPCGPIGFAGLPGLIVKLDLEEAMSFVLTEVKSVEKMDEIKAPKKGKKVTREEFTKIQTKKMEEFRKAKPNFGGGGIEIITR
ncbi:MAG: GLPGLI family protein [Bacteroidales bacterium]|nr:GLPGLI family protein [Bacteroidales bacterium]